MFFALYVRDHITSCGRLYVYGKHGGVLFVCIFLHVCCFNIVRVFFSLVCGIGGGMFLSFYVFLNFQALVMALQVLVMTFACGPFILFFFCLCVGWKMSLYLVVGTFFSMAPKLLELVFFVCDITLGKGSLGLEGGEGKKRGAFACAFLFFFGCLVDGQNFSSFFIAWNHIEINKHVFFLLFDLCISFDVCKFKLLFGFTV